MGRPRGEGVGNEIIMYATYKSSDYCDVWSTQFEDYLPNGNLVNPLMQTGVEIFINFVINRPR